jgi:cytochrome c oxidase subunit IV
MTPVTFAITWFTLLLLTVATTAVAFLDLGPFNVAVAILISCIKGGLIVAIFMHMLGTFPLVRVVAISAVVWLLILISLTFGDYITRDWVAK